MTTTIALDIPGVKPLAISGDQISLDRRTIAVEFEPMTVLMPTKQEVFEIHMPYLISVLNLFNLHMNLFCRTLPITTEDQRLYNLPFPHINNQGGLCYNPILNIPSNVRNSLQNDPVRLAIACMQVFLMGQNKYFIGSAFPKEYYTYLGQLSITPVPKFLKSDALKDVNMNDDEWWYHWDQLQLYRSTQNHYNLNSYKNHNQNVTTFLRWWESLSKEDVLKLSYIERSTLAQQFNREHTISKHFVAQRAKTLNHD